MGADEHGAPEPAPSGLVGRSIDEFVQLRAVAQTVSAQRQSIGAMRAQLDAFDEQLAVFERILVPLVDWSATWARLEEAVGDFVRPSGSDGKNGDGA